MYPRQHTALAQRHFGMWTVDEKFAQRHQADGRERDISRQSRAWRECRICPDSRHLQAAESVIFIGRAQRGANVELF